jgi:predicted transposase YbfD/YdcC
MKNRIIVITDKIEDNRQEWKVKHTLFTLLGSIIVGYLSNCNDFHEINEILSLCKDRLDKYLCFHRNKKGEIIVPSHDTLERIIAAIDNKALQELLKDWYLDVSKADIEIIQRIICIDGKTVLGSGNSKNKALHIVSAWAREWGYCVGQVKTQEKSNEITAIPEVLEMMSIKGQIVTIDAMGTQEKIVQKIIKKQGNYVLAVKNNQKELYQDISMYFDEEVKNKIKKDDVNYHRTIEKNRSQIETREYYQTNVVDFIYRKERWANLTTIGMVENKIEKDGKVTKETRYYICSIPENIKEFAYAVRGHWSIENNLHWQLDFTFREDHNAVIQKNAVMNLNIIRKFCLSMINILEFKKGTSVKRKRLRICVAPDLYLPTIFGF